MNKNELQMLGFEIVAYSGAARSCLLNLLQEVRQGNFTNEAAALKEADEIIKNTYRTLMTRGMKGCYVYCTDRKLAEHLKDCLR